MDEQEDPLLATKRQSGVPMAASGAPANRHQHEPAKNQLYISSLTGYKQMIARQLAVYSLHALLPEFSLSDLMKLVQCRKKSNLWNKMMETFKISPKPSSTIGKLNLIHATAKKTFGVPLDMLVEQYGFDTVLGPTHIGNKRIPLLLEECIRALQDKGIVI